MSRIIILSAGECSRMDDPPYGNKSLCVLAGQQVIDWQLGSLGADDRVTVVCQPEASRQFPHDVEVVTHELFRGPLPALAAVKDLDGPFTVIFADTLFDRLPENPESWIGIGLGEGGRVWEFHLDGRRWCERKSVPDGTLRAVHCGIYRFADPEKVRWASAKGAIWHHMLTDYGFKVDERIDGWVDVGDSEALARAEKAYSVAGDEMW